MSSEIIAALVAAGLTIVGAIFALGLKLGGMRATLDSHDERIGALILAVAETQKTIAPMVAMLASFQQDFGGFERHYFDSDYRGMLRQMLDSLTRLGTAVDQANVLQAVAKAAGIRRGDAPGSHS